MGVRRTFLAVVMFAGCLLSGNAGGSSTRPVALLITSDRPGPRRRRRDEPHVIVRTNTPLTLLGADARRALVRVGSRTLAVYAKDGSLLRSIRLSRPVLGGAMVADDVVSLRARVLERFAPGEARRARSYPVPAGSGKLAFHGAAGGVAVYSVGTVLHAVRLADGADVPLSVRGLTDIVGAVPTRSGLVLGVQLDRRRSAGLVGTVRWDEIFPALQPR